MQSTLWSILIFTLRLTLQNLVICLSWRKVMNTTAGNFTIERLRYPLHPKAAQLGVGHSKALVDQMQDLIMEMGLEGAMAV